MGKDLGVAMTMNIKHALANLVSLIWTLLEASWSSIKRLAQPVTVTLTISHLFGSSY